MSYTKHDKGIKLSLERFLLGIYSPKIKFLCLQYGDVEKEITQLRKKHNIKIEIINEVDLFNDIDGLASLIAACDEVVSIDNLNLHLAGHTLRKATTFFINAAREAQIPMSNSIIKMTKSRRINSQQQIKSLNAASEEIATINKRTPAVNKLQDSETLRNSTTIPLSNGGTVVVDVAVNLFSLSEEDRAFVFSIVDLAKSYSVSK